MTNVSTKIINNLRHNARLVVRELGLLNDAYFDVGVTLAERHLLIELQSLKKPTMGQIAENLLIDKSTASRLIAKAIKKGYIDCTRDIKDKRKRFITMTKAGESTLQAFEPIAFCQTRDALSTLTNLEAEMVYQGMALYAQGLKNARIQAPEPLNEPTDTLETLLTQLKDSGYTLRPFESKDSQMLYTIFKEVVQAGAFFPYECQSYEKFERHFLDTNAHLYICTTQDNTVIGGFYIKANYSGRSCHIANAAYMLHESYRNQGIGTNLIKASLKLAKNLGFQAMQYNMVLNQNQSAIKLYQKLGFEIIGTLPDAVRNNDGTYQDGHILYLKL